MNEAIFYEAVKSSLDFWGVQLAQTLAAAVNPELKMVNIDDTVNIQELLSSEEPAIVWQLLSCKEEPRDPLYEVQFGIGAKTSQDVGASLLNELVARVRVKFVKGSQHELMDYSGTAMPMKVEGVLYVSDVVVEAQEFETASAIRMVTITAAADRTIN